jgi:Zn-dependent alcohol dehydrogenase
MRGEMPIDDYITHEYTGIDDVNKTIEALHSGECLRAVLHISEMKYTS